MNENPITPEDARQFGTVLGFLVYGGAILIAFNLLKAACEIVGVFLGAFGIGKKKD